MPQNKMKVLDLLALIPAEYFDKIAEETNVDFQVKKLNGKLIFNLLLMGILKSERLSLRVLEELFNTPKFKILSDIKDDSKTRHSSIRDRITTINQSYFEELFYKIADLLNRKYKRKDFGKYSVERFDSTMVSLSSKLVNFGMQNGLKNKEGEHIKCKVHKIGVDESATNKTIPFIASAYRIAMENQFVHEFGIVKC